MGSEGRSATIVLLSDFGEDDWFVAAMRATILELNPKACIVDVTHQIPRHDIREAAYQLACVFQHFPAGTIFVAVVDPGVGSGRTGLAAEVDGRYVVAPDNGLVSWCLFHASYARFVRLERAEFFQSNVSQTFHGRDVFAPVAAHLSLGRHLADFGPFLSDVVRFEIPLPKLQPGFRGLTGQVVHIDRFGNLITNLPNDWFEESEIELMGKRIRKVWAYVEGKEGELIALPGSNWTVEIAIKEGSAAEATGAATGTEVRMILGRN